MSNSDKSTAKGNPDSDADPLIEIPKITGNELIRKSQISKMDVTGMVVRCTSCLNQINHHDPDKVKKHIRLGVLICGECYTFYGTSEFSQDESGNYNYCTWCGNGGKLFLCDFCPNVFCSTCVRHNFGRSAMAKINKEGFKCYSCEPSKLKTKVAYCDLIIDYCKNAEKKIKKSSLLDLDKSGILNRPEIYDWVLPSIDAVGDSCKNLHKSLEKLKSIGMSRSKSIKHVIKKLEEIVNSHKVDLNNVIKSLCHKYVTYLEKTKSENENETDLKQNGISNKTNLDIDTEKINSAIDTNDETKVNNKLADSDQGNQEMNKDESKMEVDNKSEVIDANYQAKLALLNESDSDDSFTTGALPIDDVISNLYSDDEKPKTEKSKESESKVARGKIRTMNNDAEKNNRKVDNDLATTDRKMDNGVVTTPIISKTASSSSELDSDDAEIGIMKSKKVGKKPVNRKLAYLSSSDAQADSESSIYISSDDGKVKKKVKKKVKRLSKRKLRGPKSVVTLDDPKLYFKTSVKLERCDHLIPEGETTITLPVTFLLEELDRQMHSLCKEPKMKEKSETSPSKSKSKSKETPMKAKAPQKMKIESNSSSSICLSSDEEDETTKKKLFKPPLKESNEANSLAKKNLLASSDSDESIFSINGEESDSPKKSKRRKGKAETSSSDDFQPRKKRKYDKLLHKSLFSDDSDKDSERKDKDGDRKKPVKKKPVTSDDNKSEKKKNSDSTTTESEDEKQTKKKKRRRIKKAAASSSDSEKKEEGGTQTTPGKSRKKIRKILTKEQLAEETKEAQNIEKERRKRVLERQKMYNMITDTSKEGNEIITRKMVLEVDPESKEEVVEIHPDLVEKLKPHQVNGVKFMWECTIESLKRLEKERGSGCILAHCMGLGKTLQVITFLHTCLTNRFVRKHIKTAMVICPYNTVLNWSREFDHWLKDIDGEVLVHELTIAKDNMSRLDILKYWHREGGVLIISYDLFRRLASTKIKNVRSNLKKKLVEYLLDPGPDIVICDEGHVLKNVNSAVSKACATLATQRRIVLTGTPLQNNLLEYHCMLSFVKPHLLGTPKEFRNRFVNPIMNGQYDDSNENDVKRMKKRIHILHKLLGGCVQRCDYAALTKFLPSKHEFVISVKLSEVQINMYRWYLDNLSRAKGQVKIRGGTLFMDYNILRNLCTHPYILKKSYERAERKRVLKGEGDEEEDFINDEDEDEIVNDDSEVTPKSNASDSDIEEIVKVYKTRSRRRNSDAESVEEEPLEFIGKKQWFDDFFSDEDQYKLELSGKMVLLMEILKECEAIGDKVIVFSQSLLTFDIIEDMLNNMNEESVTEEEKARDIRNTWIKNIDYFRMDGSTSAEFRKQYIDHFNDPLKDRSRLFLVSTKAGGLGTNLVGANRVVMLDASWNPSHDVQAIFRVYRFGQKKPVYIYRFLAQGTMEEKIYDRQVTKLSLSIRVVDEQQIDRHFNSAELQELYNFEPESLPNRPTPMVPKDTLLAEMLIKFNDWITAYHEHDSLLQNETEEDLTEEERKAAWTEYENEKEGRYEEMNLSDEIKELCKEPDFNDAGSAEFKSMSAKMMLDTLISNCKKQYPNASIQELRRHLQLLVNQLRIAFQQKHVRILRMKQDFMAKGSVPIALNKYLDDLNIILKDLARHYEGINTLVANDNKEAMLQNMKKYAATYAQQQQFAKANQAFMPNMYQGNMPHRAQSSHANLGFRAQYPTQMNVGPGLNYKQMNSQWNAHAQAYMKNAYPRFTYSSAKPVNKESNKNTAPTSQPVITEVDRNTPSVSNQQQNSHSTVIIEEIE